jgi:hypothetical protein
MVTTPHEPNVDVSLIPARLSIIVHCRLKNEISAWEPKYAAAPTPAYSGQELTRTGDESGCVICHVNASPREFEAFASIVSKRTPTPDK